MAVHLGRQMRDVLDQVPYFHLEEIVCAGLCGIVPDACSVWVQVTGLLGADL
ncbi:hypothetical protein D3C75_1287260 [compost metagenome]